MCAAILEDHCTEHFYLKIAKMQNEAMLILENYPVPVLYIIHCMATVIFDVEAKAEYSRNSADKKHIAASEDPDWSLVRQPETTICTAKQR